MITVMTAWTQRGWSQNDHLIDDTRLHEMVGRSYSALAHARRAAVARADRRGFASIVYTTSDGRRWAVGFEPSLPGRPNRGPSEMCSDME